MPITAKFSNGHQDTYKGNRDVRAAWAIIDRKTGETLNSGHSLDRARAEKTAAGNVRYISSEMRAFSVPQRLYMGADYSHLFRIARAHGYEGPARMAAYKAWAKAQNEKRRADQESRVRIEIVDL